MLGRSHPVLGLHFFPDKVGVPASKLELQQQRLTRKSTCSLRQLDCQSEPVTLRRVVWVQCGYEGAQRLT